MGHAAAYTESSKLPVLECHALYFTLDPKRLWIRFNMEQYVSAELNDTEASQASCRSGCRTHLLEVGSTARVRMDQRGGAPLQESRR